MGPRLSKGWGEGLSGLGGLLGWAGVGVGLIVDGRGNALREVRVLLQQSEDHVKEDGGVAFTRGLGLDWVGGHPAIQHHPRLRPGTMPGFRNQRTDSNAFAPRSRTSGENMLDLLISSILPRRDL